jgi:aminoglycoside 6'-N-acetyltransferase
LCAAALVIAKSDPTGGGPGRTVSQVTELQGSIVRLRLASRSDIPDLVRIRRTPEVYEHWRGGDDMVAAVEEDFAESDVTKYVILLEDRVVGWIQWEAEEEPDYRHASMDIYVDPAVHGRGVGTDAVRTIARHLVLDHGHHRLTIDPAVHNAAAIRCYTKVGFRPVGVTRMSERGPDGTWHDNLLMDMIADEFVEPSTLNSRPHGSSSSAER